MPAKLLQPAGGQQVSSGARFTHTDHTGNHQDPACFLNRPPARCHQGCVERKSSEQQSSLCCCRQNVQGADRQPEPGRSKGHGCSSPPPPPPCCACCAAWQVRQQGAVHQQPWTCCEPHCEAAQHGCPGSSMWPPCCRSPMLQRCCCVASCRPRSRRQVAMPGWPAWHASWQAWHALLPIMMAHEAVRP